MEPTSSTTGFEVQTPAYKDTSKQINVAVNTQLLSSSQLLPGSAGRSQVGNIVTTSHDNGQAFFDVATVAASTTHVLRVTLNDDFGRTFLPGPEVAIYPGISDSVGPVSSTYAWPNANYAMSNFPCAIISRDLAYSDDTHSTCTIAVRNNTAAAVNVTIAVRWILITNSAAQFEKNQSASS